MNNNKLLKIITAILAVRLLLPILIVGLLLSISIYFVYFNKQKGTLGEREGALSDFVIKDTASIDKIFIADAKGVSVTLSRNEKGWMVNDKYTARPSSVQLLLKTFFRINVKMPVSNASFNTVVKNIATNAIKVEIYQGKDKPSKVYYVGSATSNNQGTYMLLEENGVKSSVPYVMEMSGFKGYLTARFFTNPQQWRDAVVFKYQPEEIKSIAVEYFETPEESFEIKQTVGQLELFKLNGEASIKNVDEVKLQNYIERYQKIYYEMIDEELTKEEVDSTIASQPYFSITVNSVSDEMNKIVVYHMPNFRTLLDETGELHPYDVDRMYGYLNNDLFLYIQFATFDQLRLPKSYFLKNSKEN